MEDKCLCISSKVSECVSAFYKFCYCPNFAIFPQKTLGLRHVWGHDGTLTFPELWWSKKEATHQDSAAPSSCQQVRRAMYATWRQSKPKNHPSDSSYGKRWTGNVQHLSSPTAGTGVEVSLTVSLQERLLLPHLVFTSRALKDISWPPTEQSALRPLPRSRPREAQVQVSQPLMWLHRHSKGAKAPADSSGWKNTVASYTEVLKDTDSMNVN